MKKIVGALLLLLVFGFMIGVTVMRRGVPQAFILWGAALVITLIIHTAVYLICK